MLRPTTLAAAAVLVGCLTASSARADPEVVRLRAAASRPCSLTMSGESAGTGTGTGTSAGTGTGTTGDAECGVSRPTLIYGELLGKGGPYGLGVEHAITPRLALGAVVSVAVIRDQQLYTLAPYVHVTIGRRGRHALFGELGLAIVHSRIPSPVASWDGTSDTGAGGVATLGWERRGARTVIRSYVAAELGEGGLAPWLGLAFGVRL
jgi:hypothetical protein